MAHQVLDRVQETTTSVGTGSLTLAGATNRMLSLSGAGFANGDTFWGVIEHSSASEWEIALCTFSTAGPSITRATPLKSSNANATVNFSAGIKTITLAGLASKTPYADNNGNFQFTSRIVSRALAQAVGTPAITANVLTLDLSLYRVFAVTLNTNVSTLTISNALTGYANSFNLEVTADGTARSWATPANVVALNGAYVPSSANGKRDLLTFLSLDGGTTWRQRIVAQNY